MSGSTTHHTLRLLALAAGISLTTPAHGQSLYGVDSVGGAGLPRVVEMTGPSAGPCAYPNGPFGAPSFPAVPGACPSPAPFLGWPGIEGDIAVDKKTDTVWVAGPVQVSEYSMSGAQLSGFDTPLPGELTSLGMDSSTGTLWLSNGLEYARVVPACPVPIVDMGPFPAPFGLITDLSVDSVNGSLWACFADGRIANFAPGGAPTCVFDGLATGLGAPLTGIAYDSTTPGFAAPNSRKVYATDGVRISQFDLPASCSTGAAVLAAPSFAFPLPQWAVPGGPISGLAYAAHDVTFGGGTGPSIDYTGHSVIGLGGNTIELSGAAPGQAALFVDFGALCPPGVFKGLPLHVLPGFLIGPFPHGGSLSLPLAVPAATPPGVEVYMQWFSRSSTGAWESTPGTLITTSLL